jgi:tetratricopeptide (TPR) repeat protein
MKLRLHTLLLLLFTGLPAFTQNPPAQIDSLKRVVKQHVKKDSIRINLLVAVADALATANPTEAMQYTDEAFRLSQEIKSPMGIAVSYRQKANIYYLLNDYSQSVDYNFKALNASDNLKKNNKGSTLFRATIYSNLGGIYMEMREYDKAIANFSNFLRVVRKLNDPDLRREESIALLNLGETYSRKKDYQKAARYAHESLTIAEADKDYQVAAYNLMSQGVAYINMKQPLRAIKSFKKGVLYSDKSGDLKVKSTCTGGLADALFDLERYNESEKYAKQAYQIAKDLKLLEQQRQTTQLLAYIYIAQKKSQLAITYLETSLALRDSILNDGRKQEIARKEERFAQEKRTSILQVQHSAELKQQQTKRNAIAGGTGILVLASGLSFLFYKRKRDSDEQVKIERFSTLISDTELKVLRSQIDPHFIFNALNSIGYYVLNNDPFTADRYLTKFATLMRLILNNSDRAEVPLAEDMEALELYMQLESLRLDHRFTYTFDIDPSLDQQRTMIPPLLLQPFVENSIWHGLATKESDGKITIRVRKADDMLVCTVTDNGIGRARAVQVRQAQPERKSRGMSITLARIEIINRLKKSNGYMILSDLVEGTEVAITLPLAIA